jgi:hypothetical protein
VMPLVEEEAEIVGRETNGHVASPFHGEP